MVDIKFHCDEKGNFGKGYAVRAFSFQNYAIEMHNHDFYEVNIVMGGSGTHCIENARVRVERGDVFVLPPMVAHAYIDTQGLEVYHILLQKRFLDQNREKSELVNGFVQLTEIEPFLRSNFSEDFYLKLNQSQLLQLKEELQVLDDAGEYAWEECAELKYHTAWKLLYWFSWLLSRQMNDKKTADLKYEARILRALEYIHKNYSRKIVIEDLCREVYLSRSTFLRHFRTVCGISPMEYLNDYRCKTALQQLDSSKDSKTEIAHNCGFYDLSHMERSLKKYLMRTK